MFDRYKNVALHFVASKYVHVNVKYYAKKVQGVLSKWKLNMDDVKLKCTWRTQVVQILPQIMTLNGHSICINSLCFNWNIGNDSFTLQLSFFKLSIGNLTLGLKALKYVDAQGSIVMAYGEFRNEMLTVYVT